MAIIYETINLYNLENRISPWRYIGSDQNNNPSYLGSNTDLKKDIMTLGEDKFIKNILEDCGEITNKELRKVESEKYLKPNKVRTDESYYNKTEHYGPGCGVKGMKHSTPRSKSHIEKIIQHRTGSVKDENARKLMRDKKIGTIASDTTKQKMSEARGGEKNHNSLSWTVVTPNNEILSIKGLRKWANDHSFNYYDIYNSRNGWKSVKHGTGSGGGRKKKEQQNAN